jgi:hypothetical protein
LVNPWSNFAAFFKFHLNTSKSPNVKVVYFVEGHNFHVEWHCWFEVQIGEKCRSTPPGTVHWSRVFCKVPLHFMQNPLIKTLYALSRSCRGSRNLEFSYKSFGPLLLKNFEKRAVKQCYFDVFQSQSARARVVAALRAHPTTSARRRTPSYTHVGAGLRPLVRAPCLSDCAGRRKTPWSVPRAARAPTGRQCSLTPLGVCVIARRLPAAVHVPCRAPWRTTSSS